VRYNGEAWMNASTFAFSRDYADTAGNKNPQNIKCSKLITVVSVHLFCGKRYTSRAVMLRKRMLQKPLTLH